MNLILKEGNTLTIDNKTYIVGKEVPISKINECKDVYIKHLSHYELRLIRYPEVK